MQSKLNINTAHSQPLRNHKDKNIVASEDDIILQMMIKEARVREEAADLKQKKKLGMIKIECPYPVIKIQDSGSESQGIEKYDCEDRKRLANYPENHCQIKKGILNIKIAGKIKKKGKKGKKQGWFSSQSTLDRYVTNKMPMPNSYKIKQKLILSSKQTTLDNFFENIRIEKKHQQ